MNIKLTLFPVDLQIDTKQGGYFALFNYAEIKIENPEYIKALAELTGKDQHQLSKIIAVSSTEAELADNLVAA